jgi:cobalt-zinc-cadmium efflux system membrane fusion protein
MMKKITSKKLPKNGREIIVAKSYVSKFKSKLQLLSINPVNVENGKLTSVITIYAPYCW